MSVVTSPTPSSSQDSFQIPKLGTFVLLEPFDNASKLDETFSNLKFEIRMARISLLNAILFKRSEVEGFIESIVKHESPKLSFKFEYFPFEDFVKDNKQHGMEMLTWLIDLRDLMEMYNTRQYIETPKSSGDILVDDINLTKRLLDTSVKLKNGMKVLEACCNIKDSRLYLKREDSLDVIEVRSSLLLDFYLAYSELELFLTDTHPLIELFKRACNVDDKNDLLMTRNPPPPPIEVGPCFMDGSIATTLCTKCKKCFCDVCLTKYHLHKERKDHGGTDFVRI